MEKDIKDLKEEEEIIKKPVTPRKKVVKMTVSIITLKYVFLSDGKGFLTRVPLTGKHKNVKVGDKVSL